jgi:hypothetical protein
MIYGRRGRGAESQEKGENQEGRDVVGSHFEAGCEAVSKAETLAARAS